MTQIKNLHFLAEVCPESEIDKMEQAALMHRRHANITFKIVAVADKKVTIQVAQDKSAAGIYFPKKRLIEIVHETFDRFFPDRKILVHPIPFEESPVNGVDVPWINKRMLETGTRLKDIAADTGINYTQLGALVKGNKPLSQPMKALFWFYFAFKTK